MKAAFPEGGLFMHPQRHYSSLLEPQPARRAQSNFEQIIARWSAIFKPQDRPEFT